MDMHFNYYTAFLESIGKTRDEISADGYEVGKVVQVHHIIEQKFGPKGGHTHPLITELVWDIDHELNLIGLPTVLGKTELGSQRSIHKGSHTAEYDNYVKGKLDSIKGELDSGDISKDQAQYELNQFVQETRNLLESGEIALNHSHYQDHATMFVPTAPA